MSFQSGNKKGCWKKNADASMAGEQATPKEVTEDIFSQEKIFRGFCKKPIVLLERCDIPQTRNTSRIDDKHNNYNNESNITRNGIDNIDLHLQKLALQCSVILIREDLEKLKSDVLNKLPVLNSPVTTINKGKKTLTKEGKETNISFEVDRRSTLKRVSFSEQIIVHLVDNYVRCKECKKIFVHNKLLRQHIRQKHMKRKTYVCNYCSKKFLDRYSFKCHIKLHCYVCGSLRSLNKHLKNKCSVCCVKKMYLCKTCNETYFKFMDLRDHSFGHIGTFFVCDICKEQFTNKCSLVHHTSFLHSDECPKGLYAYNSESKLYCCNFCDYSSPERDMIASHVKNLPDLSSSLMTGYKDHCFCDVCLKRFDSETVMLQHKSSHDNNSEENTRLINDSSTEVVQVNSEETADQDQSDKDTTPISNIINLVDGYNNDDVLESTENLNKKDDITKPTQNEDSNSAGSLDYFNPPKKAIVDPVSKKTIISRFNCDICGKYYSSNYTLSRHKSRVHMRKKNQCKSCEETFVWPELLKSHKCIRAHVPPMSANVYPRPGMYTQNDRLETQQVLDSDGEMGEEFVMPAPIVELTEYDQFPQNYQHLRTVSNVMCVVPLQNANYRLVVQEVPIEF